MRKNLLLILSLFATTLAFAQEPATFEDVPLGSGGIWQPPTGENEMSSGGWLFTNSNQYGYWGGFTASNRTDLNQSGLDAQYTAATGCGYDGSTQYAVAYTMGVQTEVYAADGQSHTVTGCYVTNNLWTYQDILQGGYGELPYGGITGNDPDWFKVTAIGKNASGQTVGTLDFYLADYRFANNAEDYVLNTWEWFDLSPLGSVATISFELSSSRGSGYNMITPAYFCMDNFNGGGAAPDLPPYIVNPVQDVVFNEYPQTIQVNLNGVATDPDDPDEQITYSIVSNSNPSALTATMSGKILVMMRQNANQATANLTMRATSDGQYVDFIVHVIINAYVDQPPYIVNPVQDVVFNEYPQTIQVNLNGVATDPDDPDEQITYSIVSNSNPSALTATMNGKILVMTRQNANQATANLTMRATSDGQYVDFTVHVIINAVIDLPPYIVHPVQDVVMDEFPKIVQIDLDGVATDDDDPDELIEYTLLSNSNEEALSATMAGKILILERLTEDQAEADVAMRATSDGQYVDFNVHVIMNQVEGVDENRFGFAVYPNPTHGQLILTVSEVSSFDYRVYDHVGQCVASGKTQGTETRLDLSYLNKGIYFISVEWEDNRLVQKVIVR
jgi:putative lipoic acid-binding regulatory protein